jgi:ferredoxin
MAEVSKVWIEEGCISCNLCMDITPEVFLVEDGQDCCIKPDAAKWFEQRQEEIILAANDCPVEVIQWE